MPTRNGHPIVVEYLELDLTHPAIEQAKADLGAILRKVGDHLKLGININDAGDRGIAKLAYPPEEAPAVALMLGREGRRGRPWKAAAAVVRASSWAARGEVRDRVSHEQWRGPREQPGPRSKV